MPASSQREAMSAECPISSSGAGLGLIPAYLEVENRSPTSHLSSYRMLSKSQMPTYGNRS